MKRLNIQTKTGKIVKAIPVSQEEWDRKHRDFKNIRDGVRYMLFNENGMAVSRPVYIREQARLAFCKSSERFQWEAEEGGTLYRSEKFTMEQEAKAAMKKGIELKEDLTAIEIMKGKPRRILELKEARH